MCLEAGADEERTLSYDLQGIIKSSASLPCLPFSWSLTRLRPDCAVQPNVAIIASWGNPTSYTPVKTQDYLGTKNARLALGAPTQMHQKRLRVAFSVGRGGIRVYNFPAFEMK